MSKNGAVQKAQTNFPSMRVSEVAKGETNAKVINFKSTAVDTQSEEVKAEPIEEAQTVTISEVMEKVNAEFNATEPEPVAEPKPVQSIEEIKRKSEVLNRLSVKWDSLNEKRRRVENFSISHDVDTASVKVKDAQGEVFESNSPKTIGKLIEFWKVEFAQAIAEVEKEMREIA